MYVRRYAAFFSDDPETCGSDCSLSNVPTLVLDLFMEVPYEQQGDVVFTRYQLPLHEKGAESCQQHV